MAKPVAIKGPGRRCGGCARKVAGLTWGDLHGSPPMPVHARRDRRVARDRLGREAPARRGEVSRGRSARRAARVPSWFKSSRTDPKRGPKPTGGGNASPGAGRRRRHVNQRSRCAGQGARREAGSEGFAANRRAVADVGEPVGQIQVMPSLHYGGEGSTWDAWAQQGVCGRHGGEGARVTPGGLARSRSTGPGTWANKPQGEIAGDAVREVGVIHGTREPGQSKSPGTVPARDGGAATQKAPPRGKGSRRVWRAERVHGRVREGGLMVAEAMTEASLPRKPRIP